MNNVLLFVLSCQLLQTFVFAQNNECLCSPGTTCPSGYTGVIDPRVMNPGTCSTGYTRCCPTNPVQVLCGERRIEIAAPVGTAPYGAYPWMVAILTIQGSYVGGGVLISPIRVLTVAHKVADYEVGEIIARLGEWTFGSNERYPTVDILISRISLHPQFNSKNLQNDIAVLRLNSAAPIASNLNINTACFPSAAVSPGTRCLMSGWGKDSFNGNIQSTLKEVELPVLSQATCQAALRRTRLGENFVLHNSFMCAGGQPGYDACTDDGGSPLVCPTATGQYQVVGLVTWGIGCGEGGVPGVYTDVFHFRSWISAQ